MMTHTTRCLLLLCLVVVATNAACPNAWDSWTNWCYLFVKEDGTWQDAEQQCVAMGAHLASSHSAFENHYMLGKAFEHFNHGGVMWIGGDNFNSDTELYAWTDGTPFDFEYWRPRQPPPNGQHCIAMTFSNAFDSKAPNPQPGQWIADKCGMKIPFVCKKNAT